MDNLHSKLNTALINNGKTQTFSLFLRKTRLSQDTACWQLYNYSSAKSQEKLLHSSSFRPILRLSANTPFFNSSAQPRLEDPPTFSKPKKPRNRISSSSPTLLETSYSTCFKNRPFFSGINCTWTMSLLKSSCKV